MGAGTQHLPRASTRGTRMLPAGCCSSVGVSLPGSPPTLVGILSSGMSKEGVFGAGCQVFSCGGVARCWQRQGGCCRQVAGVGAKTLGSVGVSWGGQTLLGEVLGGPMLLETPCV